MDMRRKTGLLVVGAAGMLLSGCSAVPEGVSGLTVDEQGRLIGVVRTCDTTVVAVDVLRVERARFNGTAVPEESVARGEVTVEQDSAAQIPLAQTVGVGSVRDLVDPRGKYRVRFVTEDTAEAVGTVTVELAELEALEAGTVLTGTTYPRAARGTGAEQGAAEATTAAEPSGSTSRADNVVSVDEFWDTADEFCGDG